jgi:hypothetical protein
MVFGAAAWGRDLAGMAQGASPSILSTVNRAAKADRAAAVRPAAPTRTISLRLQSLSDTSVLVRIPLVTEARDRPSLMKPADQKTAAACEPVVSVLVDIVSRLQPGRCVT